jgi:hypothetical protein
MRSRKLLPAGVMDELKLQFQLIHYNSQQQRG